MISPALRVGLSVALCASLSSFALAQKGKPEPETVSGKVSSVTMKGKAASLKVEGDGGETLDILVTPKLNFAVTAKADKDLFRPGVWVSADNAAFNDTNKLYFAKDFVVHIGPAPAAKAQKNMNGGVDLCGQVAMADDKSVSLRPNMTVMFDEGFGVTVQTNDASLIEEGAPIQVEGTKRGEKFLPTKVTVTLDRQLTADDVFGNKGKTKKPAAKTAATKTAAGAKDEKADGVPQAADPFKTSKPAGKTGEAAPKAANPFTKKPEDAPAPKSVDPFKEKPKDAPGVEAKKPGAK